MGEHVNGVLDELGGLWGPVFYGEETAEQASRFGVRTPGLSPALTSRGLGMWCGFSKSQSSHLENTDDRSFFLHVERLVLKP